MDEIKETITRKPEGVKLDNEISILAKYKIVDGCKIVAKNLKEVKELVDSGLHHHWGIVYRPESNIKTKKVFNLLQKYKYFLISLFLLVFLLCTKTNQNTVIWQNFYIVTLVAHVYLSMLTFKYSIRIPDKNKEYDTLGQFCAHNAFCFSLVAFIICSMWYHLNILDHFSYVFISIGAWWMSFVHPLFF